MWCGLSGLANVAALVGAQGSSWYSLSVAIGYGLLLPVLAILQMRHARVRQSGAILGTAAGMATITVGIGASSSESLVVAALFVRGIWWWTIGKMWADTNVMPALLGRVTQLLAAVAFIASLLAGLQFMGIATLWTAERVILGLWAIALAYALWRSR